MFNKSHAEEYLHVGVEELLQLLVDIVDADLLKAVVVKDLKASDVEDSDVGHFLHGFINPAVHLMIRVGN